MTLERRTAWLTVVTTWVAMTMVAVGCASGTGDDPDAGVPTDGPVDAAQCALDQDCDDGTECNVGTCDEGTCVFQAQDDLCDEGVGCIVGGCSAGTCVLEADDIACGDGNDCSVNMCDSAGDCQVTEVMDGVACGYGLGTCQSGSCDMSGTEGKSVFRATTVNLVDPHVYVSLGTGCLNAADVVDGMIQEAINNLELNFVFTFDPLAMPEDPTAPLELWMADCTSPDPEEGSEEEPLPISCTAPADDPLVASSSFYTSGTCLAAQPDRVHFGEPNTVAAPCWVTEPTTFVVDLDGIVIPLDDAQAGATMVDADTMAHGLILGFLDQETAEQVILPEDILLVGGMDLASLLPPVGCDDTEARNTHEGRLGWWFHLNFTAERITDHSGF